MTTVQIAWLAGLLEGEGSFTYGDIGVRRHPRIGFDSTDRDVTAKVAALFGCNICVRAPNKITHHKPVYIVRFGGAKAVGWMMTIYPLMGVRRRAKIREVLLIWLNRRQPLRGWSAHNAKARIDSAPLF